MKHLIFFSVLCFFACKQQPSGNVENLYITLSNDSIKASTFIKKAAVIKLETNDNSLIQRISKIKYTNNKIYILDMAHNSLLIFNNDGSFDKKLSRTGSGPGEYAQLTDFFVQDNFLYILDFTTQSILKYNSDLEYLEKFKYTTFGSSFAVKNDDFWIYNEPTGRKDDYQFTCFGKSNTEPKHYLPRNFLTHKYNWSDVNTFVIREDKIFLSPKYRNIIYSDNHKELQMDYKIEFSKNNFPEEENINDYDIFSPEFHYIIKQNFYMSDKYLIVSYFHENDSRFCFHDLRDKTTLSGIVKNDLLKDFIFFPRWGNDNYLIAEVASYHVAEDFSFLSDYNEQLKDITHEDNPVVIIYTLKTQ